MPLPAAAAAAAAAGGGGRLCCADPEHGAVAEHVQQRWGPAAAGASGGAHQFMLTLDMALWGDMCRAGQGFSKGGCCIAV